MPDLLWLAAERLGLGIDDAAPAEEADLISIDTRVRFRHPLVRSAIYRGATLSSRRRAHQALADALDRQPDNELRAWHRAQAAATPDEAIARSSKALPNRQQAWWSRGCCCLSRPGDTPHARSSPAGASYPLAGRAKLDAGAPDAALELVAIAEDGTSDDLQSAQHLLLRARIAFAGHSGGDASLLFLAAAARLTPLDEGLARETYLEALMASNLAGRLPGQDGADPKSVARAAKAAPPAPQPPRAVDLLLDGLVVRFNDGYSAAAPLLNEALKALRRDYSRDATVIRAGMCWPRGSPLTCGTGTPGMTWPSARSKRSATAVAALLPVALAFRAWMSLHAGRFPDADALLEEARLITRSRRRHPAGFS